MKKSYYLKLAEMSFKYMEKAKKDNFYGSVNFWNMCMYENLFLWAGYES